MRRLHLRLPPNWRDTARLRRQRRLLRLVGNIAWGCQCDPPQREAPGGRRDSSSELCVRLLIKAFSHETRRVEEKFPFPEKRLSVAILV
jgi:hypothetical protein